MKNDNGNCILPGCGDTPGHQYTKRDRKILMENDDGERDIAGDVIADLDSLLQEVLRVREMKRRMEHEVSEVDKYLKELDQAVIGELDTMGLKSVKDKAGNMYSTTVNKSAIIEDYQAFSDYVISTGRLDLLHKRVTQAAVNDMWENGEEVPGIGMFTKIGLSIRKG